MCVFLRQMVQQQVVVFQGDMITPWTVAGSVRTEWEGQMQETFRRETVGLSDWLSRE